MALKENVEVWIRLSRKRKYFLINLLNLLMYIEFLYGGYLLKKKKKKPKKRRKLKKKKKKPKKRRKLKKKKKKPKKRRKLIIDKISGKQESSISLAYKKMHEAQVRIKERELIEDQLIFDEQLKDFILIVETLGKRYRIKNKKQFMFVIFLNLLFFNEELLLEKQLIYRNEIIIAIIKFDTIDFFISSNFNKFKCNKIFVFLNWIYLFKYNFVNYYNFMYLLYNIYDNLGYKTKLSFFFSDINFRVLEMRIFNLKLLDFNDNFFLIKRRFFLKENLIIPRNFFLIKVDSTTFFFLNVDLIYLRDIYYNIYLKSHFELALKFKNRKYLLNLNTKKELHLLYYTDAYPIYHYNYLLSLIKKQILVYMIPKNSYHDNDKDYSNTLISCDEIVLEMILSCSFWNQVELIEKPFFIANSFIMKEYSFNMYILYVHEFLAYRRFFTLMERWFYFDYEEMHIEMMRFEWDYFNLVSSLSDFFQKQFINWAFEYNNKNFIDYFLFYDLYSYIELSVYYNYFFFEATVLFRLFEIIIVEYSFFILNNFWYNLMNYQDNHHWFYLGLMKEYFYDRSFFTFSNEKIIKIRKIIKKRFVRRNLKVINGQLKIFKKNLIKKKIKIIKKRFVEKDIYYIFFEDLNFCIWRVLGYKAINIWDPAYDAVDFSRYVVPRMFFAKFFPQFFDDETKIVFKRKLFKFKFLFNIYALRDVIFQLTENSFFVNYYYWNQCNEEDMYLFLSIKIKLYLISYFDDEQRLKEKRWLLTK